VSSSSGVTWSSDPACGDLLACESTSSVSVSLLRFITKHTGTFTIRLGRFHRVIIIIIGYLKGKKVKADIALPGGPHLGATGRHLPYGIKHLPPDTSGRAPPNPSHAGWYSIYLPGGMEGWVDLVDLIAPRPGVELATFRSRVRSPAPPRQPFWHIKFADSHNSLLHRIVACMNYYWKEELLVHRALVADIFMALRVRIIKHIFHNRQWRRPKIGSTNCFISKIATIPKY